LVGLTDDEIKGTTTEAEFEALLAERDKNHPEFKGWRLPTARENASFVGGPYDGDWVGWKNGNELYSYASSAWPYFYDNTGAPSTNPNAGVAGDPATGRFPVVTDEYNEAYSQILPAAGYRYHHEFSGVGTGTVQNTGTFGLYWSSTPGYGSIGHFLSVRLSVFPVVDSFNTGGKSIRCVRDSDNPLHPSYTGPRNPRP
jgi:hypothetical protein